MNILLKALLLSFLVYTCESWVINVYQERQCTAKGGVLIESTGRNACVKLERIK